MTKISEEQLSEQRAIAARIRVGNRGSDRSVLAFVDTYGCQQNEADSEIIRGQLHEMGYAFTDSESLADLIIINTCAVREHAEQRVLGNVGHLIHTKRAGQIIALCGCAVQQKSVRELVLKSYRHVDVMFGPHELWRLPEILEKALNAPAKIKTVEVRESDGERVDGLPTLRKDGPDAWLNVMYGCDNFCSYCVVPYIRGRERSREFRAVVDEAKLLIAAGKRKITLLGQNVNSYGRDLYGETRFSDLLRTIAELEGDFTLHFRTSHPKDASEELFRVVAEQSKVDKSLHLPFQSGSDRILAAMNRGYTAAEYLSKINRLKELAPNVSLSSDIIVGFPGETDAEFEDTLKIVGAVRFDKLFTFIYSPRPGTPAAEMPDPFTRAQKQTRFNKLIALQRSIDARRLAEHA